MKNIFQVMFLSLLSSLLIVFGCEDALAASKTSTITIKSVKKVSNFIANYDQDFVVYTTKDKKTVYGLEFDKKLLKKKSKLTFDKNADAGILYILENGYPKSKITGDSAMDRYITESAIWLYMEKTGQGTNVNPVLKNENNADDSYGLVANYIKPLVNRAIEANNSGYKTEKASIKVDNKNYTLTLSQNRKYYESDYISVDLIGSSKYTVSSKATILDINGEKKKKFNASEKFKVRISVNKILEKEKITVTVKATGKENVAKIYVPSNEKYQSVVGLFDKKRSLKESFELVVTTAPNCKYLDGNYHDKDGNVVDEQTYRNVCSNVCKIVNENYYDENGEETSKLIFDKECSNSCVIKDNDFYGINSRKVDAVTFEKECPIVSAAKASEKEKAEKAAKAKAEKEKAEKAAKAKAEKEKAEKAAKAKAEKEKAEKAAKAKAEKEKAEKAAKAKAEKEKAEATLNQTNEQNVVNPNGTLEVEVPNTSAEVPLSNIIFGTLLILMGIGLLYKRNKAIN